MVKFVLGTEREPTRLRLAARALKRVPSVALQFYLDFRRYVAHSNTLDHPDQGRRAALITATYHNIEKGLSLPSPRPGFGGAQIEKLLNLLDAYPYPDDDIFRAARDTLGSYVDFNKAQDFEAYPHRERLHRFLTETAYDPGDKVGGVRPVTREAVIGAASISPDFFMERHSVRQYSDKPVDMALIDRAVAIAQKTPVVCNRQSGHVHIVADPEMVQDVLKFQGGARGFAEHVDKVIVITTHLANFWASGERNQCWVDGGLFAMSLIYGLHAQGLGTCALNWSRSVQDTNTLRRMIGLGDDEVVIMLLSVGHLPDEFVVPVSNRKHPLLVSRVVPPQDHQLG